MPPCANRGRAPFSPSASVPLLRSAPPPFSPRPGPQRCHELVCTCRVNHQSCLIPTTFFFPLPLSLPRSDAARLACTCRRLRTAWDRSWAAGAFQPVVAPDDGTVREPQAGRFCVEVTPGEDVQSAVSRCRSGGAVLLLPGVHVTHVALVIDRDVHLFGRGAATLDRAMPGGGTAVRALAPRTTLDGISIRGYVCVAIESGTPRLQQCLLSAGWAGISIHGSRSTPVVVGNRIVSPHIGCLLRGGAGGRLLRNDISGCAEYAMWIGGVDASLRVEGNVIHDNDGWGIRMYTSCPAAFSLGDTNVLHDNAGGDVRGAWPIDAAMLAALLPPVPVGGYP